MLFASDPHNTALITFREAARALDCTVRDIKSMVIAGRLPCFNFGHDKDRILMNSSRVPMVTIKKMLISQILTSIDHAIATADERQAQREIEAARQRSLAWKAEWERRHTGEAYYAPDGQWYVYTLSTPVDRIFYVGKGCGPRVHQHESEAKTGHACHKCNTIRKVWAQGGQIKKAIVFRSHSEQAAYDYESTLIARIGLPRLTNVLPGGGKAVRVGPKRREGDVNWREVWYYMTLRGATRKEIQIELRDRMRLWIKYLDREIYVLRRYGSNRAARNATALRLEYELEQLRLALGDFEQLTLF